MWKYILTILLLLFITAYYKLYYKIKKQLVWYKNKLESLGYKVRLFEFRFLKYGILAERSQDQKNYSDAFYRYKNEYFNYDILLYSMGWQVCIQFQSPQLIKQFQKSENMGMYQKMKGLKENMQRSAGLGISFTQGKQWKRKRSIMNSVFNYQFLIQNIPKMSKVCDEGLQFMEQTCEKNGKVQIINGQKVYKVKLFPTFFAIFGDIILQCFFGTKSTNQTINGEPVSVFLNKLNIDTIKQSIQPLVILLGAKFASLGLRKKDKDINQRIKLWREVGTKLINNRLAQLQKKGPRQNYQDIVEALILKKKFDISAETAKKIKVTKQQAENYDFNELIEQFCTFFSAGSESSSKFAQMMIYLVAQNKEIQQKLRTQINEFIKSDEDITKDNLKKLTYIDWIQNQTRRYYGPGSGIFPRIAVKDHYISNIPIKKGISLNIQTTSAHYNEKYFKDPKVFRPERWESQSDLSDLMGFGGGPRACIGKHLALLDSKIALVKFMRRYKSIKLPKQDYKMIVQFGYLPQPMDITVVSNT